MNENFDRLAIALARNVTRRHVLRRFGLGLGISLIASLGLENDAQAKPKIICDCTLPDFGCSRYRQQGLYKQCIAYCGACLQP